MVDMGRLDLCMRCEERAGMRTFTHVGGIVDGSVGEGGRLSQKSNSKLLWPQALVSLAMHVGPSATLRPLLGILTCATPHHDIPCENQPSHGNKVRIDTYLI